MTIPRRIAGLTVLVAAVIALHGSTAATATAPPTRVGDALISPIQHIVVIYQENHSFDNVLGKLCAGVKAGTSVRPGLDQGCNGVTSGKLPTGKSIALAQATDVVPEAG